MKLQKNSVIVFLLIHAILSSHSIFATNNDTTKFDKYHNTYKKKNNNGNVFTHKTSSQDTIQKNSKIKTPYNPENPLFREYNVFKDYRVNQSIIWGFRGLQYCAIGGFFIAGLIGHMDEDAMQPAIVSSILSGTIGLIGGIGIGLKVGNRYNHRDSIFNKANQLRPFINYRLAPLPQHNAIAVAGDIRFFNSKWYAPDILMIGYMPQRLKVNYEYDEPYYNKFFIGTYFNCTNKRLINVYCGILLGYAKKKCITSTTPFIDLSVMGELNLFDFLLFTTEFMYEPYGVYQDSKKKYDVSYRESFRVHLSVGTFLF